MSQEYKFGKQNYKVYFKIPYDDRLKAKELKYSWDKEKKSWYKNLYLNKNNKFKLDFDLCEKHNTPDIFECFNNIKISQETEQEK
jgi:hypothetical protein